MRAKSGRRFSLTWGAWVVAVAALASAVAAATPMIDWGDAQRLEIPAARLPPSAPAGFRAPTVFQQQTGSILTVLAVVGAQTGLIVALVWASRRRRAAQRQLEARARFERLLSALSVSLATVTPDEVDGALETALCDIAATLGIDWVWRWPCGGDDDAGWDSSRFKSGESEEFGSIPQMPPSIRRRLAESGVTACSALAVPLLSRERAGAIFWIARDPDRPWSRHADNLRVVGAVAAAIMQRQQAELALERSDRLKGAILNSLPAHIAVLDRDGVIIAANDSWFEFDHDTGIATRSAIAPGANFVDACRSGARADVPGAVEAVALIEGACRGEKYGAPVEYRSAAAEDQAWFLMRAAPLRRPEGGAVITHWDISRRKRSEMAVRESEDRFRRLADALPVAVWVADTDGRCSYFNKEWLQTTGRSLEEERGDGWLESVHPHDRTACMDAYLHAFERREGFQAEYRILRHDGQYRWFLDTGTPRYGSDGAFHGYVGGCVDITDRKEGEHRLRDLTHRLMGAQDDERRRIARELHDHLSQQLALLAIDLQQLALEPSPTVEVSVPVLQAAWRRTTEIASDVHAMSHRLHPSKMEVLGLVATIQAHCREVTRQSLVVRFEHDNVPRDLSPDWSLSVFRVIEEALGNVSRHSGATEARVSLAGIDAHLVLRVSDNGRGFIVTAQPSDGLGLVSMRERLQSLDGTLSITSVPGKGTDVEARVPLAAPHPRTAPSSVMPAPDAAVDLHHFMRSLR